MKPITMGAKEVRVYDRDGYRGKVITQNQKQPYVAENYLSGLFVGGMLMTDEQLKKLLAQATAAGATILG